jgi:hypothetical protein
MLVYVKNRIGKPLMPTTCAHARKLLKSGKAKVISRMPFVIKLNYGSSGYFSIENIHGIVIHPSVNVKKDCRRLSARKTTLIERGFALSSKT